MSLATISSMNLGGGRSGHGQDDDQTSFENGAGLNGRGENYLLLSLDCDDIYYFGLLMMRLEYRPAERPPDVSGYHFRQSNDQS